MTNRFSVICAAAFAVASVFAASGGADARGEGHHGASAGAHFHGASAGAHFHGASADAHFHGASAGAHFHEAGADAHFGGRRGGGFASFGGYSAGAYFDGPVYAYAGYDDDECRYLLRRARELGTHRAWARYRECRDDD